MKFNTTPLAILLALAATGHAAMTFVHPGAMETKEELLFVKGKIAAGAQPWAGQYQNMKQYIVPGSGNTPTDEGSQRTEAQRAYGNALAYWYTGKTIYADQAIACIKEWTHFTPYPGIDMSRGYPDYPQLMLNCSWMADWLGPAAELVRGYMSPADLAAVQNIFKTVFLPSLKQRDASNGNRDEAGIKGVLSIAVFMEDEALFNYGITRFKERMPAGIYLKTDGPHEAAWLGKSDSWSQYGPNFASPNSNGLTQESCRDNNHHGQMVMAAITTIPEIAWHQGVDLYGQFKDRLTAAMELMAKQIVTGDMQGTCLNSGNVSKAAEFNTFDVGYNHYHNRMGIALPNTLALLPQTRQRGSDWVTFFETLTHADLPATPTSIARDPSKVGSTGNSFEMLPNGICRLHPQTTGSFEISVFSLDGTRLSRVSVPAIAGQPRSVSLGLGQDLRGLFWVQLRSKDGSTAVKSMSL